MPTQLFRRLKDIDAEGTGAGLALVKKFAEKHTGEIWVESPVSDGRGSRFYFTIPISKKKGKYRQGKRMYTTK